MPTTCLLHAYYMPTLSWHEYIDHHSVPLHMPHPITLAHLLGYASSVSQSPLIQQIRSAPSHPYPPSHSIKSLDTPLSSIALHQVLGHTPLLHCAPLSPFPPSRSIKSLDTPLSSIKSLDTPLSSIKSLDTPLSSIKSLDTPLSSIALHQVLGHAPHLIRVAAMFF